MWLNVVGVEQKKTVDKKSQDSFLQKLRELNLVNKRCSCYNTNGKSRNPKQRKTRHINTRYGITLKSSNSQTFINKPVISAFHFKYVREYSFRLRLSCLLSNLYCLCKKTQEAHNAIFRLYTILHFCYLSMQSI